MKVNTPYEEGLRQRLFEVIYSSEEMKTCKFLQFHPYFFLYDESDFYNH